MTPEPHFKKNLAKNLKSYCDSAMAECMTTHHRIMSQGPICHCAIHGRETYSNILEVSTKYLNVLGLIKPKNVFSNIHMM